MDLKLKDLNQYTGTQQYHKIDLFSFADLSDGIIYLMENGYSWFITDCLAVIGEKLKDAEFLGIQLILKADNKAVVIITDGDEHELYRQNYNYTNVERQLQLFYANNVLMLGREY